MAEYDENKDEQLKRDDELVGQDTDENSDEAPDSGVEDEVLVDGPAKLAHEDLAATQAEIDDENTETRAGRDFEGQPTAAELRDEREDEAEEKDES